MDFNSFSLDELYKNNNKKTNNRSDNCKGFKVLYKSSKERYLFQTKCYESYSNPRGHLVSIKFDMQPIENNMKFLPLSIMPTKVDMKIRCQCPAFLYWGSEYIATQLGYIMDGYKENRFPEVRDPNLTNLTCKHVALITSKILDNKNLYDLRNIRKYQSSINLESDLTDYEAVIKTYDEMESISIYDTLNSVDLFLSRNKVDKKLISKFLSIINEDNYEKIMESLGVIV